jgi:hypothetical protein
MAKRLTKYRGYTPTEMKTRANIPVAGDISVGATYIDCSNIKLSEVKTLLSESVFAIETVCTSANVNVWSGYGPTVRTVAAGILVNSAPSSTFSLGSFTGYNHTATTPHWDYKDTPKYAAEGTESILFLADVNISEPTYNDMPGYTDTVGIVLLIYEGATLKAYGVTALSTLTDIANLEATWAISSPGLTADKSLTAKIRLCNVATTGAFSESNIACSIPGITDEAYSLIKLIATILNPSSWSGWTLTNEGLNKGTGQVNFDKATKASSATGLTVTAKLYSQFTASYVDSAVMWGPSDYTGGTDLVPTAVFLTDGSLPIDDYGYRVDILFEESS